MNVTKRWIKLRKLCTISKDSYYLTLIPYEIHCGKHSGFPDCCIKFFITRWITKDPNSKFRKDYCKRLIKLMPGYIPCPKCVKNKTFITVKKCPVNCKLKRLIWGNNWVKKNSK